MNNIKIIEMHNRWDSYYEVIEQFDVELKLNDIILPKRCLYQSFAKINRFKQVVSPYIIFPRVDEFSKYSENKIILFKFSEPIFLAKDSLATHIVFIILSKSVDDYFKLYCNLMNDLNHRERLEKCLLNDDRGHKLKRGKHV